MSKKDDALKLAMDWYDSGNENPDDFANMIKQVIALAQQQAQGCDYCNHPQYAGTKCKNCGREQPAQQHIEHCIWARNGNTPCPHVQPAQQKEPVVLTDIEIQNCFQQRSKDKTNEKRLIAEQITKTVLEKLQ